MSTTPVTDRYDETHAMVATDDGMPEHEGPPVATAPPVQSGEGQPLAGVA